MSALGRQKFAPVISVRPPSMVVVANILNLYLEFPNLNFIINHLTLMCCIVPDGRHIRASLRSRKCLSWIENVVGIKLLFDFLH